MKHKINYRKIHHVFLTIIFITQFCSTSHAQLWEKIKEKVKETTKSRIESKADKTTNKALDKTENKIDSLFIKNPAKQKNKDSDKDKNESGSSITNLQNENPSVYRKFTFVRGYQTIFTETFETEQEGDFPKNWSSTAGGEIVTIDKLPGKWLKGEEQAFHAIDYFKELPLNCTIEFDLFVTGRDHSSLADLTFQLASFKRGKDLDEVKSVSHTSFFNTNIDFHDNKVRLLGENYANYKDGNYFPHKNEFELKEKLGYGKVYHVSVLRQNSRLVFYINTTKIYDVKNAFPKDMKLNNVVFNYDTDNSDASSGIYVSNIIVAETFEDTRKDIFVDGKLSTTAILFETNSAKIIASSLPVVTMIGNYLTENPTVKLTIEGYTDSNGDDAMNEALSQKRAEAVCEELIKYNHVDKHRLVAVGKGEKNPVADNNTANGRAQNRRVVFIKN